MSELEVRLPSGWSWHRLQDVAAEGAPIIYGILQPGPDLPSGIPYVRPTEIVEDAIDVASIRRTAPEIAARYRRSMLRSGDIVLSIVGTIGKVALVPPELEGANITQSSVRIRPREDLSTPRYLSWALRSPALTKQFDMSRLGTAVPRLNVAHVRSLKIPIAPPDEQDRIVAEIEKQFTRLDAGVAALRRVQANLKRYRASVLKAACEGRLVPTEASLARAEGRPYESGADLLTRILTERRHRWSGRGKYKEPVGPVASPRHATEGWTTATFDQVCSAVSDEGRKLPKAEYALAGRFPVIDQGEQNIGGYTEDDSLVFRGALPVVLFGDHTRRFKLATEPFVVGADGVKLIGLSSAWDPKFIWYQFQQLSFEDRGYSRHFQFLRQALLLLPPLAEQHRIVAEVDRRLSVLDELEALVSTNLQRATRLRQSILQRAFAGELLR